MLVVGSVLPRLSAVDVLKMESEVLKMESELDTSKKGKDSFRHLLHLSAVSLCIPPMTGQCILCGASRHTHCTACCIDCFDWS